MPDTTEPTSAAEPFRLGEWTVEPSLNRITRGAYSVQLEPKAMDVLVFLAEHPGEVLSQQAIIDAVWAQEFVGEGVLRRAITVLREALGDDARSPTYIETITKRGYRLIAEVTGLETAVSAPSEQRAEGFRPRWTHALAVAVAAVIALLVVLPPEGIWQRITGVSESAVVRSIAVLPLDNLSGDPEQEYFADAMTEELITELAKIGGFDRVISSTTSRRYKATDKTMPEIAHELGVDAVLEGGVLHAGDQVRITAQLIHAPSDTHLWAESFQRELTDILALQGEIARTVADATSLELTPEDKARLAGARHVDPEAYKAYLRGRGQFARMTGDGFERARELFGQAIADDPEFALAYAALADSYAVSTFLGWMPPTMLQLARANAAEALARDDTLSEAHLAMATVLHNWDWDWAGAEREYLRAIELEPSLSYAHVGYSVLLCHLRRLDEATEEARRAVELDPLSVHAITRWTSVHYHARDYDEMIELVRAALTVTPDHEALLWELFLGFAAQGAHVEALSAIERYLEVRGEWEKAGTEERAAFERARSVGDWRTALTAVVSAFKARAPEEYTSPFNIALFHSLVGSSDAALGWLERAYRERDPLLPWASSDPAFDGVRADPRFEDLMRRMKLPTG